jgi:hypothetical protein
MWWWLVGLVAAVGLSVAFVPFGQQGISLIDRLFGPRLPTDREDRL